jgi:hypothetical protein
MPSSRDIRHKRCHRGRSCEPTFFGSRAAPALVGAFVGAITGALQVLMCNRDSDTDGGAMGGATTTTCTEFAHAKVGFWPSTSAQLYRSDFSRWRKSRREVRIAQTTPMTQNRHRSLWEHVTGLGAITRSLHRAQRSAIRMVSCRNGAEIRD